MNILSFINSAVKKEPDTELSAEKIAAYRSELSARPQVQPETENYFVPLEDGGYLYCRKVTRQKDIATLGRVHKKEHLYIVAKGSIAIRGEFESIIYHAGDVINSKPGTQRLVVSIEDSVTITMHKVSSMDIDQIERELVEDDEDSNYLPGNKLKPEVLRHQSCERITS